MLRGNKEGREHAKRTSESHAGDMCCAVRCRVGDDLLRSNELSWLGRRQSHARGLRFTVVWYGVANC